jgi:hypothetical protein
MTLNNQSAWRIVLMALSLAALLSLLCYALMWNVYWDRLPRFPDKVAGRVYADNFHGVIVYETREESFRLHALENASLALIVVTIVAAAAHDWRVRQCKARGL